MRLQARLEARDRLKESEKALSQNIFEREIIGVRVEWHLHKPIHAPDAPSPLVGEGWGEG